MSILHVNQIKSAILEKFSANLDKLEIKGDGEQVLRNRLSKGLAAYSISALGVEVSSEVLIKSLVDGSDDNGIDLIYYDNKAEIIYLVQSKWNEEGKSEPELGDIQKFTNGIHDLLRLRFDKFNKAVNNRIDELKTALLKPGVKIKAILAYTAINQSEHSKRHFTDFCSEHNDLDELIQVIIMNQTRLHESLTRDLVDSIDAPLTLKEWGIKAEPYKAFYGQLSAIEVADLYQKNGEKIFKKNIRNLLGETDINIELKETLFSNNDLFWYFNNGITIVCDDAVCPPAASSKELGIFNCTNISIVNGAQTVGTIGSIYNMEDEDNLEILKNTYIPTKIITNVLTSPKYEEINNFTELITKANNRQNKIEARDFVSLDKTQIRLQKELLPEDIHYIVMRGQNDYSLEKSFDLEECTRALSYANSLDATVRFKREKNSIWANVEHPYYLRLFNDGTTGYYAWNLVIISRKILRVINEYKVTVSNEEESILTNGDDLIGGIVFDLIDKNAISRTTFNYDEILNRFSIKDITLRISQLLVEVVKKSDKVPQTIFKNFTDCNNIALEIQKTFGEKRSVDSNISIEQLVEQKFLSERAKLMAFHRKVSFNEIATKAFEIILSEIKEEKQDIGMISNLHVYKRGEGPRVNRFLFRLAVYSKVYLYFEYKNYGVEYNSLLLGNSKLKDIIDSSEADGKRVELTDISIVKRIMEVIDEI